MSEGATIVWVGAIILGIILIGPRRTIELIIRTVIRAGIWRSMK